MVAIWSGVKLRVVVDDISAQVIDAPARLVRKAGDSVAQLAAAVRQDLRLVVSQQKTGVLARAPA
eukprot:10779897-Lingulodinium_polyedra.AAC.1